MVLSDHEIKVYSSIEPDVVIIRNNPETNAESVYAYHWSDVDGPIQARVAGIIEQFGNIKLSWIPFNKNQHPDFKPMISPFEESLVNKNQDGDRLISYGTSSYGYDIRCADQFKVFTNINSTIVDPKNFDENCFVDVEGEFCVIPPNSFALARTVEYFNIPRNLMTVCLGKSTYARCFSGDTEVALVNGTTCSFKDMVERANQGERFWGYSQNIDGDIVVSELINPRKIGTDKLLLIELDNGEIFKATPDHQIMMRDGSFIEAKDLVIGSSVMPLYRKKYKGYESVYQPQKGRMISTHYLSDMWNVINGVYADIPDTHRHHLDHNKENNNPTNITRIFASQHLSMHNANRSNWTEEERAEHGRLIAEALAQRKEDEEWATNYSKAQSERAKNFWSDAQYANARQRLLNIRLNVSDETRDKHRKNMIKRFQNPDFKKQHSEKMKRAWHGDINRRLQAALRTKLLKIRSDITETVVRAALLTAGTIRGAARLLNCDRSVFRRFPLLMEEFAGGQIGNNHKVVSIELLEGEHDVFCLTVPNYGNFALEAGVFVKNCGIVVNVTPFEPGWEGYVTLEFSNTTPLPAKIYANEGVAQVLFMRGSMTCGTSYSDRGGKYQGQTGVVLPRM